MHLVDEQHRLLPRRQTAPGIGHDGAHVLDAGRDRRQLHEPAAAAPCHQVGQRRLAGSGWAPQDDRGQGGAGRLRGATLFTGMGAPARLSRLHEAAQRRSGSEQVRLPLKLIECARPHPHRQRRVGVHGDPGVIRAGRLEQVHAPTLSPLTPAPRMHDLQELARTHAKAGPASTARTTVPGSVTAD